MANIGKTQSRGIEVTLNTRNIVTKDFFWETSLTYTKYKDRWKERTPDWKPNVYEKETDPIRAIYSRRADHIMQIGEEAPTAQPDLRQDRLSSRTSTAMYAMKTATRKWMRTVASCCWDALTAS